MLQLLVLNQEMLEFLMLMLKPYNIISHTYALMLKLTGHYQAISMFDPKTLLPNGSLFTSTLSVLISLVLELLTNLDITFDENSHLYQIINQVQQENADFTTELVYDTSLKVFFKEASNLVDPIIFDDGIKVSTSNNLLLLEVVLEAERPLANSASDTLALTEQQKQKSFYCSSN